MKTAELTGAHLDYWVARAEGTPADQLAILPRDGKYAAQCVYTKAQKHRPIGRNMVVSFSCNWEWGGPLIEKHEYSLLRGAGSGWIASAPGWNPWETAGDTPLQAICRAVVRAKFGDEVEEVAACD